MGFSDRADGVSCTFFDVGLQVGWPGKRPQWLDAAGRIGGTKPFSSISITSQRAVRINVTTLVRAWWSGATPKHGILLRFTGQGFRRFEARESSQVDRRPQLIVKTDDGRTRVIEARADAALDCSTYKGLGQAPVLVGHGGSSIALDFALPRVATRGDAQVVSAELVLVTTAEAGSGTQTAEVYALVSPIEQTPEARQDGIAQGFPGDKGIESHPDVLFADGFGARHASSRWKIGMPAPTDIREGSGPNDAEMLWGPALAVTIPKGRQLGLDWRLRFRDQFGSEPDEVYFRYHLRLGASWKQASDGGKLPGLAGTYGVSGWGGRPWNGEKGWSLRGWYGRALLAGHLAEGKIPLGTYAYHANAHSKYGEVMTWVGAKLTGVVEPERWYSIEQRLKLNSPGKGDGVLEVWVDGVPVLARYDLRLRDVDRVRIEEVWLNVFHGGTDNAPADMHALIDQVVVARRYIGPLAAARR